MERHSHGGVYTGWSIHILRDKCVVGGSNKLPLVPKNTANCIQVGDINTEET